MNLNSKTVPLEEAVNASTREHPVLPHFRENESRLIADLSTPSAHSSAGPYATLHHWV